MRSLRTGRHLAALALVASTLLLGGWGRAEAQPFPQSPLLNVTAGQAGLRHKIRSPGTYGLEYRMRPFGRFGLVPAVGFAFVDNDATYAYAELKRDFWLANGVVVTPSFGLGRFDPSLDFHLGQALEFRSGLEVAYELRDGYRVGIALFHLSNGGLAEENPGSEVLVASFSLPVR
jgi:hypothetical protein